MGRISGKRIVISPPRRVTIDMLALTRDIPTIPVQRMMNLGPVVAARKSLVQRPSWASIFIRAFALTSIRHPELRRVYVPGRSPHLWQSDASVAMIAIERLYRDEPVVFIARIKSPETQSLIKIDGEIAHFKNDPLHKIGPFDRTIKLGCLPGFLRRFILRRRLNCTGPLRVERSGTFGVSVYSALGSESLHPLAPVTTLINYGVIAQDGSVAVRFTYDHRVTDGSVIARAQKSLEEILLHEIVDELSSLRGDNTQQAA
ncbi:2-oxo acid dehydrogenase subunit E2 [bacterium]|nr:2-oxo acid dehydrogenase subunit E2 [bacterium]